MQLCEEFLINSGIEEKELSAVIGRGGLLAPLAGGIYRVNERMRTDLKAAPYGSHASNLGAVIAYGMASRRSIPAFIADPVVVDELAPPARYSGTPEIERKSIFHALNQKSAARAVAKELGRAYTECRFIVAHMGGGVSVGAHDHGRVVDVNNALDGEGPFSPERAGGLPAGQLISLAMEYAGREKQLRKRLVGKGGLIAYLGTNSLEEISQRIDAGDAEARSVVEAMGYQIAKEIASLSAVLKGKVDAVILTGGMAYNDFLTDYISDRVSFIAQVRIIAGERELEALTENALAALRGGVAILEYEP
jgi:butyrate kinase